MSATAGGVTAVVRPRSGWTGALVVLGLALALFGFLFREEIVAAVHTWETSTAYNHCWLVLPVAAWLAWVRRDRLAVLGPVPSPALALLILPPAVLWLLSERMGIMEGRQLAAIGILWAMALAILGWQVCRAMAAPLLYLIFLVPFGAFAVPLLQTVTAYLVEFGLRVLGIPHYVDSFIIETPAGTFLVAEACAGLRFLVAALAFGALYAVTLFRSPGRRAAVLAAAVIVPILANGARALGIVVLAQHLGSAEAAAADHVVYGWGFFSLVLVLLILAGLPFREDSAPAGISAPATPRAAPGGARFVLAGVLVALLSSAAPGVAAVLDEAGGEPMTATPRLAAVPGCTAREDGALDCGGLTATARLLVFPARTTWAGVAATRRRLLGEEDEAYIFRIPAGDVTWDARQAPESLDTNAAAAWLDGHLAGDGLRSRAMQALNSLRGNGGMPVVLAITLRAEGESAPGAAERRTLLTSLAEAQSELAARADALSRRAGN
ncbi:exosortase A [Muricoccus aerilatus]|uniref:exosortase A n=1 Tax=Muricoccus aerilatus TaxID=452982 RepID=UPI000694F223|nr:exosortase A [Roseomonas aerilata]